MSLTVMMAFVKLFYIMMIHDTLGPLMICLARMTGDIANFMLLFSVIVGAFAIGMSTIYIRYDGNIQAINGNVVEQPSEFVGFFGALKNLFWGVFGQTGHVASKIIVPEYEKKDEYGNVSVVVNNHYLTEGTGYILFGIYQVTAVIICLNVLIAMLSNTFANVQENADVEWKFAKARIWFSYFGKGDTLPPPYNLLPTPKAFQRALALLKRIFVKKYKDIEMQGDVDEMEAQKVAHKKLMSQLIQRYIRSEELEKETADEQINSMIRSIMLVKEEVKNLQQVFMESGLLKEMPTTPEE